MSYYTIFLHNLMTFMISTYRAIFERDFTLYLLSMQHMHNTSLIFTVRTHHTISISLTLTIFTSVSQKVSCLFKGNTWNYNP